MLGASHDARLFGREILMPAKRNVLPRAADLKVFAMFGHTHLLLLLRRQLCMIAERDVSSLDACVEVCTTFR
ncbi:hypothetical protein BG60_09100 [Caballeronia zhejiangensis]|uniref:Uncharacterized protein n=1 Tax=Caballeronia zhejiangensis TaxID=871203 RepID=A0A656QIM2_9BURK|nr:hypothetical protein BG58_28645 [Caballeronia jiangsuensis]KDR28881.1 hypothetical protein BG60_09100 [Caballeronia zhejiangensis]KWU19242.1 hypothetical protein AS149_13470 [Burkholderia cenocepacia]